MLFSYFFYALKRLEYRYIYQNPKALIIKSDMNFKTYLSQFEQILNSKNPIEPYTDTDFLEYAKLNLSRTKRWLKTGKLSAEMINTVKAIKKPQTWIVITEPWCGDAAHSVPFIEMIAQENPLITTVYELRDTDSRIEDYLTNGSKSIPKLIMKDENGVDIGVWGPRPQECQAFFLKSLEDKTDLNKVKETLQLWYNQDKGAGIQQELIQIIHQNVTVERES